MALEVQNQQPHPLQQGHASGGLASHDLGVLTGPSLASLRRPIPVTLDLFHTSQPSSHIELQDLYSLPLDCQNILKLETADTSYTTKSVEKGYFEDTTMSRRNGNGPKLDLKLNLSPPRANPRVQSPSRSASASPTSPPSSCVSSELNQDETLRYSNSPEATSMMLVGCPRCLMYVMLSEEDPRCPKCKSTVLLDVLHDTAASATATTKKTKKS